MKDRFITVRAPVSIKIGPVPQDITATAGVIAYGHQNFGKIFSERGIAAHIHGEDSVVTFSIDGEQPAKSQTANGLVLDERTFRIQPAGPDRHTLEISTDLGTTFRFGGTFADAVFAKAIGDAWVDGRIEPTA
ncbi:hypothetical protein [Sphingosinicella sp. BN140058]|uniref:hypothetical protein n=1 Tax=Sphingosinicella sp. BN140058 TaxID=1892855 RepID=UPI001011AF44|nr:hypothetical protein [Sphingosinicella sp. BN140058]QAY80204.1 hypothetical protein ETR14_26540 [Sphingosinicella sp. BN140058]